MLSDRHCQVLYGNAFNKQRKLNNGLPGGLVFFNLYISDRAETNASLDIRPSTLQMV